ncbi:MAG TPA: SAM-dependent methyltransferase [Actinocrinis sp.]|nr:SAM-dependent methyltransferase [Actinocrinis sp.]
MQYHRPAWAPDEIDIERPSVARMYDFLLGGSHNFAADRALAQKSMQAWPDLPYLARANRAFMHRAVSHISRAGVDQFLDLGSGIPTGGNVHDVAQAVNPQARTVYVDSDPVAIAHSNALLGQVAHARVLHADLRDPQAVLGDPVLTGHLDLARPVAVLMISVLPFVPDEDDPARLVAAYRDATVGGSYLAMSHGTKDYEPKTTGEVQSLYAQTSQPGTFRTREQIRALMDGYELLPPGLVDIIDWRPATEDAEPDPLGGDVARYSMLAAVGRLG